MKHVKLRILLTSLALLSTNVVSAQQPARVPVLGVLLPGTKDAYAGYLAAFMQGMKERGRVEGNGFVLDIRWADGQLEKLTPLAIDLTQRNVDVLLVSSAGAAIAARNATASIPIVQLSGGDPTLIGLANSQPYPKGNLTGISNQAEDLTGKSLEQLILMVPNVLRFGVLVNPTNPAHEKRFFEAQQAASLLKVKVHPIMASSNTLETALNTLSEQQIGGLLVLSDGMFLSRRRHIIDSVAKVAVPSLYQIREFAIDGGLMSYGISIGANYHRAATLVDLILKGAKPADLPIQLSWSVEMVINMATAKALGRPVPRFLLARANEIIN